MAEQPGSEAELSDNVSSVVCGKLRLSRPMSSIEIDEDRNRLALTLFDEGGRPIQGLVIEGLPDGFDHSFAVTSDNCSFAYSVTV